MAQHMEPGVAYLSGLLWLPKELVDLRLMRASLTFTPTSSSKLKKVEPIRAWAEGIHHIGVPRYLWGPINGPVFRQRFQEWGVQLVDLRPKVFQTVAMRSKVVLDAIRQNGVQQQASAALLQTDAGGAVLSCIVGDTKLHINRAGKGTTLSVEELYQALHHPLTRKGPNWAPGIQTRVRSLVGDRVGLHPLLDVIKAGARDVHRISLADGKTLTLTDDHEVLTVDGFMSIRDGLSPGMLVVTDSGQTKWGKKAHRNRRRKLAYKRLRWSNNHPYAHRNGVKSGPMMGVRQQWVLEEHRAVYEAHINHLTVSEYQDRCWKGSTSGLRFVDPSIYDIHHRDGDITNNAISNLKCVLKIDHHTREHCADVRDFGYGIPTQVAIRDIEPAGTRDVYDVVCAGPHHNFVANGVVVHNCGVGKTVVSLHTASLFRAPFIIIVDSSGLQQQWLREINKFLCMDDGMPVPVGLVGDGRKQWDRPVVIALIQTLYKMAQKLDLPEELRTKFAVAIFDEAQIMGAKEFAKAAPLFYGRRWWTSATPARQDGLEKMYYLHLGPPVITYLQQDLKPSFYFYRVQHLVDVADPQFRAHVMLYGQINTPMLYSYLAGIQPRTYEIAGLVRQGMAQGRTILVLTRSRFLLQQLGALLPDAGVIHGDVKGADREVITRRSKVLLAQFNLGEKALDKPDLDMLVVCEPFHWVGSFQQIIGRTQRMVEGKNLPIVLFVEDAIGPCLRACRDLRRIITTWPREMGGPFRWQYLGNQGGGTT